MCSVNSNEVILCSRMAWAASDAEENMRLEGFNSCHTSINNVESLAEATEGFLSFVLLPETSFHLSLSSWYFYSSPRETITEDGAHHRLKLTSARPQLEGLFRIRRREGAEARITVIYAERKRSLLCEDAIG